MGEAGGGSGGIRFSPSDLPSYPRLLPPDRHRAGRYRNGVICRERPSLCVNHLVTPRTSEGALTCAMGRAGVAATAVGHWQVALLHLLVREHGGCASCIGSAAGEQAYDGSGG